MPRAALSGYCDLLGRRAALGHGDVGQSERKAILREPPDLLLTTPESVEAVLMSIAVDAQRLLGGIRAVVVDEAGMADTRRLAKLVEVAGESRAKLLLVGDDAQLSPIGAGGLFTEISKRAPTAELTTVHRARETWEREAWAQLRRGDSVRALAEYASRDRLHIEDTHAEAGDRMVDDWTHAHDANPGARVVMLTDSSNDELDRLNALAQDRRVAAGELR